MRSETIRDLFIGLIVVAIQVILFRHLKIYGAESDLVLIWLLSLCLRKSRTEMLLYAAFFGLLQDSLTDLWGLHTFSKTLLIFVSYGYLNKISENRFIIWQTFLVILAAASLHNLILASLSGFVELYSSSAIFWSMVIGGSLYTAVIGSFFYLVRTE